MEEATPSPAYNPGGGGSTPGYQSEGGGTGRPYTPATPGKIYNNSNNIPWLTRSLSNDDLHVTLLLMKKVRDTLGDNTS